MGTPTYLGINFIDGMMAACSVHHKGQGGEEVETHCLESTHVDVLQAGVLSLSHIVPKDTSFTEYSNPNCPN